MQPQRKEKQDIVVELCPDPIGTLPRGHCLIRAEGSGGLNPSRDCKGASTQAGLRINCVMMNASRSREGARQSEPRASASGPFCPLVTCHWALVPPLQAPEARKNLAQGASPGNRTNHDPFLTAVGPSGASGEATHQLCVGARWLVIIACIYQNDVRTSSKIEVSQYFPHTHELFSRKIKNYLDNGRRIACFGVHFSLSFQILL